MKAFRTFIASGLLLSAVPLGAQTVATPPVVADSLPIALQWYRTSAEMRGLFIQTYRTATRELERRVMLDKPKNWAVIMDADETVLDNSQYQMERGGRGYSNDSWNAWVRSLRAIALPGSADFTKRVHELGGKVVIVTNRDSVVCPETAENFPLIGLMVDEVLCKPANSGDKNPRFEAVQSGTAPSKLHALDVLMWFGDNIEDFPKLSQKIRGESADEYAAFGRIYWLLPNPLYGSFTKNKFP